MAEAVAIQATEPTEAETLDSDATVAADLFPGHFDAPETDEPDGDTETEATAEQERAAAPGKPKAVDLVADDKLFDERALATKGGILAARKALLDARGEIRSTQAKAHDVYVRTKRRDEKSLAREERAKRYESAARAIQDEKLSTVDLLTSGNAEQIIDALGKLTRRDGVKLYQEMTDAILANGKRQAQRREPDPEVGALKKEMAALREQLGQERMSAARSGWINGVVVPAVQNAEKYPGFAHMVAVGKGQKLVEFIEQQKLEYWQENGRPIHDDQLLKDLDAELRQYVPTEKLQRPAAPAPAAPKKPAAPTPKRLPGSGPNPANAGTSAGGSRELTEDERLEEIVRDTGFVNRLFGFG